MPGEAGLEEAGWGWIRSEGVWVGLVDVAVGSEVDLEAGSVADSAVADSCRRLQAVCVLNSCISSLWSV